MTEYFLQLFNAFDTLIIYSCNK